MPLGSWTHGLGPMALSSGPMGSWAIGPMGSWAIGPWLRGSAAGPLAVGPMAWGGWAHGPWALHVARALYLEVSGPVIPRRGWPYHSPVWLAILSHRVAGQLLSLCEPGRGALADPPSHKATIPKTSFTMCKRTPGNNRPATPGNNRK